ncbi:MAG: hypothetical protein HFE83_10790 [Lachnospiraceae bacterium]|nr:hypothetical protein [Lachnospiraceae bacterium]
MKRLKKLIGLILAFSVMMSITALAKETTWENSPGHHDQGILLPDSATSTSDRVERYGRGEIISAGEVELTNLQNGSLRIEIETYAHKPVDAIYQTVFLEQWDDASQEWEQIDSWDFEKQKGSDTHFTHWSKSFTVSGCTVNKYYRVCGLHMVELNGETESCSSRTNGIKLTKK